MTIKFENENSSFTLTRLDAVKYTFRINKGVARLKAVIAFFRTISVTCSVMRSFVNDHQSTGIAKRLNEFDFNLCEGRLSVINPVEGNRLGTH